MIKQLNDSHIDKKSKVLFESTILCIRALKVIMKHSVNFDTRTIINFLLKSSTSNHIKKSNNLKYFINEYANVI